MLKSILPPTRQKRGGGLFKYDDFLFNNISIQEYDFKCQEKNRKIYIKNKMLGQGKIIFYN